MNDKTTNRFQRDQVSQCPMATSCTFSVSSIFQ